MTLDTFRNQVLSPKGTRGQAPTDPPYRWRLGSDQEAMPLNNWPAQVRASVTGTCGWRIAFGEE